MKKDYCMWGGFKTEWETIPFEAVKPVPEVPIKTLTCCCCGEQTKGRQWWNRDTGFGLCSPCAERIALREDKETMKSCYGQEGIHYSIKEN